MNELDKLPYYLRVICKRLIQHRMKIVIQSSTLIVKYEKCQKMFYIWKYWLFSVFQQAYQTWACSVQIPYFHQNHLIPPCRTICDEVERVCPTFRPSDRQPLFAGQPLFYCNGKYKRLMRDQTKKRQWLFILFFFSVQGGLLTNSDYGQRPYCFDTCHLRDHSVSSSSKTFVEDRKTTIECFDIEFLPLSTVYDSLSNQTTNTSLSSSAISIISSISSSIFVNLVTMIIIYRLRTNIFNE